MKYFKIDFENGTIDEYKKLPEGKILMNGKFKVKILIDNKIYVFVKIENKKYIAFENKNDDTVFIFDDDKKALFKNFKIIEVK